MNFRASGLRRLQLALAFVFAASSYSVLADVAQFTGGGVSTPAAVATAAALLDPEQAFKPQIRLRDRSTVEIRFDVVPGYYLYRDRIRLDGERRPAPTTRRKSGSPPPAVDAAVAKHRYVLSLPPGKSVDDLTFGKVEVFDRSLTFLVDLADVSTSDKPGVTKATVSPVSKFILTSQGCAVAGVCFPAQQHEFLMPAFVSNGKNGSTADGGWLSPSAAATSLGFGRSVAPATSMTSPR